MKKFLPIILCLSILALVALNYPLASRSRRDEMDGVQPTQLIVDVMTEALAKKDTVVVKNALLEYKEQAKFMLGLHKEVALPPKELWNRWVPYEFNDSAATKSPYRDLILLKNNEELAKSGIAIRGEVYLTVSIVNGKPRLTNVEEKRGH
jgi:hypothetical protein